MIASAWKQAGLRTASRPFLAFLCAVMLLGQLGGAFRLTRMSGVGISVDCHVAHHDDHAPTHPDDDRCCVLCAFASSERLLAATLMGSPLAPFDSVPALPVAAFAARDPSRLRPPAGWASSWSAQAPPASL